MRVAALIAFTMLTLICGLGPGHADKRVALVIGNGAYRQLPALINPKNDADAVGQSLQALGFETIVLTDLDRSGMNDALDRFSRTVSDADIAIVYYSGHGMQYGGRNYLLPVETRLATGDDVNRFRLMPLDDITDVLQAARGARVIILDACRNNPLENELKRRLAAMPGANRDAFLTRGLVRIPAGNGLLVAYATQSGEVAADGTGHNSPFTAAFLNNVSTPEIDLRQMFFRVQDEVNRVTGGRQRPEVTTTLIGDFYLNLTTDARARIAALGREQAERKRLEQERLAQEAAERERIEQELLARERAEQEQAQREGAAKAAAERERIAIERERTARELQERQLREQAEQKRLEQERLAKEAAERVRIEQERLARERAEQEQAQREEAAKAAAERERERQQAAKAAERERIARERAPESRPAVVAAPNLTPSPASPCGNRSIEIIDSIPMAPCPPVQQTIAPPPEAVVSPVVPPNSAGPCRGGATTFFRSTRCASPLSAAEERALKPKTSFKECDKCPEMVVVPPGSFTMGSPEGEKDRSKDEGPSHRVTLAKSFAVAKFAVTFDEWDACVADGGCNGYRPDDGGWGRGRLPVINVSWNDAQTYVAWLLRTTGRTYRLLSEAEREYVTRAGTLTPFWWGSSVSTQQANYDGNFTYGNGSKGEYRQRTVPVDSFPANPWGFFQVHGNVLEWTQDCWHDSYNDAPADGAAWVFDDCNRRILRGGSFDYKPRYLRAAFRNRGRSDGRGNDIGFRVARTLMPNVEIKSAVVNPTIDSAAQESKVAALNAAGDPAGDKTAITDPATLREVRERLYELNFDPGPLNGPVGQPARRAIREFQQMSNLSPDGEISQGLLRRLREARGLKPWGALVYARRDEKWGMSWSQESRQAAVASARVTCGSPDRCPVEVSFFGTECGAFAHSDTSWAILARKSVQEAKEAALSDCRKGGRSCRIIATACADGAERYVSR